METKLFWESRWAEGSTGWHLSEVHRFLTKHSSNIDFLPPKRVFIPLCGKCLELMWFYEKELEIVGVEIVEAPVKEFFKEHNLPYEVEEHSWAKVYQTVDRRLKIYIASIYDIHIDDVGKFDIIWDRGSKSAIEIADRERYAKTMKQLCGEKFTYLLSTKQYGLEDVIYDYPPRPISHELTKKLFGEWCKIELILQDDVTDDCYRRAGIHQCLESYFVLTPK